MDAFNPLMTTSAIPRQGAPPAVDNDSAEAAAALADELTRAAGGAGPEVLGQCVWIQSQSTGLYMNNSGWSSDGFGFAQLGEQPESFHLPVVSRDPLRCWFTDADKGAFVANLELVQANFALLWLFTDKETSSLKQWRFEEEPNGSFYIQNRDTYDYLYSSVAEGKNSGMVMLSDQKGGEAFLWRIIPAPDAYNSPAVKNARKASYNPDYGDPPQQDSLNEPPERTVPRFIGECALPALAAKDDGHDLGWKMRHSPYYLLRRYSQWRRTKFATYDGFSEKEHEVTYEWGVTKSTAQEIEESLNMSVTAEAGFSFKGIGASISGTVSYGLSVSTSTQWQESYNKSETFRTIYPNNDGKPYAIADWERRDVYELVRAEHGKTVPDDVVLRWEVTVPNVRISRSFQAPPPKRMSESFLGGLGGEITHGGLTFIYDEASHSGLGRSLSIHVEGRADSNHVYKFDPNPHDHPDYNNNRRRQDFYRTAASRAARSYRADTNTWPSNGGSFEWRDWDFNLTTR